MSDASTPAPKKDRVYGSKTNPKGSAASGKSKAVKFSDKTEASLKKKVEEHNEKAPKGRKATLGMLKAVYRRGAGAFSTSHRPSKSRDQWAMARVNAFLKLLKSGRPENPKYVSDNDLLPASHPKSSRGLKADASDDYSEELFVVLLDDPSVLSPEEFVLSVTEYLGLGYEAESAVRAVWMRAVNAGESPYSRLKSVAEYAFESNDADLLPKIMKEV